MKNSLLTADRIQFRAKELKKCLEKIKYLLDKYDERLEDLVEIEDQIQVLKVFYYDREYNKQKIVIDLWYSRGLTPIQIMEQGEIGEVEFWCWMKKLGLDKDFKQKVLQLYQEGYSIPEIQSKLGCSYVRVIKYITGYGPCTDDDILPPTIDTSRTTQHHGFIRPTLPSNLPTPTFPIAAKTEESLDCNVVDLDLSPRVQNCLQRAQIGYIGELVQLKRKNLLSIKNLGPKGLEEISEILTALNLKIGMKLDKWVHPLRKGNLNVTYP